MLDLEGCCSSGSVLLLLLLLLLQLCSRVPAAIAIVLLQCAIAGQSPGTDASSHATACNHALISLHACYHLLLRHACASAVGSP
jgi:hypothetical protein